jgi:hypothetical protein
MSGVLTENPKQLELCIVLSNYVLHFTKTAFCRSAKCVFISEFAAQFDFKTFPLIRNANKLIFHEMHLKLISRFNGGDNNLSHG